MSMPQEEECNIKKILNYLLKLQEDLSNIQLTKEASVNNNTREVNEGSEIKSSEVSEGTEKKSSEASEISEKKSSEGSEKKRASWFGRFNRLCKTKDKGSSHGRNSGGSQGGSTRSRGNSKNDKDSAEIDIRKLQTDILQMINAFTNLTDFQNEMSKLLESDPQIRKLNAVLKKASSMSTRSHDLKEIRRKIFTLKVQIPSVLYKQSSKEMMISEDSQNTEDHSVIDENGSNIYLPSLHISKEFPDSSAFEEVLENFKELEITHKLCLLSFAVFPENREVNRTMLMYWWIGEGYIGCDGSENDLVKEILDDFSAKRLLEPVEDESKLKPSSYKMDPHVHSAVIHLSKFMDLFKLYNEKGLPNYKKTDKKKVCLVRGSSLQPETKTRKMEPEELETVFNSSERYPDFAFKWFPSMKSLKVLYLGRWERTAKRHIEVESTDLLKDIKDLKNVKLVSFQGISRIEKLENPICLLPKLVILDLKACYNLETLPSDIGLLQSLNYLDVSDCYMLDGMPKGISKLTNLQVLKGFVIGESDDERNCAVKHLKKLRKLSIIVNRYSFKVENLTESLKGIEKLQSLKIAWGWSNEATNEETKRQGGPKKKVIPFQEATKTIQNKPETQGRKSNVEGDGNEGKTDLEEGKKQDEVNSESLKSEKAASPSREKSETSKLQKVASFPREEAETIQNKPDNQEVKSNLEGDGDKGKVDPEEGKKKDEVGADISKSDKVSEGEKKASPPTDVSDMIQEKPDDINKVGNEGDGAEKEEADLDEGKKRNEGEANKTKSDNVVEEGKTTSPPQESKDTMDNKTDDKTKGNADPEEGTKHDKVEAEIKKSNNGVEGGKTTSLPQESKDTSDNKTYDITKGKTDPEEGKKQDEIEAGISKSNNVVEGAKTTSPPQESKDTIDNKTNDITKGKADQEEGKKHNEVEAEIKKSNNGVERGKTTSLPQESKDMIDNKTDDITKGKADQEEGKKHDEVEAEIKKSNNGVERGKTTSLPQESKDTIDNKTDDITKGKADQEEGKKHDEVEAEIKKSNNGVERSKTTSLPQESKDTIDNKTDDITKGKADQEEGKKHNEVEAEIKKSNNGVERGKTTSLPQESKDMIDNKTDDITKGKADQEEGKKHDEVEAEIKKSNNGVERGKTTSLPQESKDTIDNKIDDITKGKADQEEGKKHDEVEAEIKKSNNGVERSKTTSLPQESKDTIDNKTDDITKGKVDQEEGKKHDEVEAKISKSNNDVEGIKKASSARESTEAIQNKPEDHGIDDKHNEKDNLEEGKKKDEVKADSPKSDRVIEESKETIQSKPDDHRENRKLEEKGDGEKNGDNLKMVDQGEAKTLKSHKTNKFSKKLSFSGKYKALFRKKRDDLKGDNTMAEENYETPSPSRPTKDSRSNQSNWFTFNDWGRGSLENLPAIDHTPKLPSTLKKLELECFPEEDPPTWLNPKDLNSLEKLSIKGGWLSRISDEDSTAENKWTVQILRLKYLHKFEVKWKDLQTMFPKMTLLEKYECPKIAFCPTDGNGVWRKPQISPNM